MVPDPITRLNAALEGRYRIERELGEGGMAMVYLADDLKHERKVALKVLKPELAAVVGAERFLAEIKTTANLQHPHILPLYDSGEADSLLFYVMPYVAGESLRDRLDREHQLPVDDAVQIAKNVAEALAYAHGQGVIHRDIKPANILLQAGKPVISDFGIALAVGAAGRGRLTETGLSLGTPHYMSPEQATGDQNVGPPTDIYALGCVLYEMLVGEPPFTGSSPQAVLGKIITGDADPVAEHRRTVPANVEAAISKALEKVPADRFLEAGELVKALASPLFRHGGAAAGVGHAEGPGRWVRLLMGLGLLAVAFVLGIGWQATRPGPPTPIMRQVLSSEGWAGLETPFGRRAAVAPDGSSMVLPMGEGLGLKSRGSTEVVPIAGTDGARDVAYAPNGQWIAYAVGTDLYKRPLGGGASVRLADDTEGGGSRVGLAWLDDGTILYEPVGQALAQIPEEGGAALARIDFGFAGPAWVHGLPGSRGALVVFPGFEMYVVDLRDLSWRAVQEDVVRAWYTRTGHLVYVRRDGTLMAASFDLEGLSIMGSAVPLFDGVRVGGPNADMLLGDDGTLLFVRTANGGAAQQRLVIVGLDGSEQELPLTPREIARVGWSPDGEKIVYEGAGQIYLYDVTLRTSPRQLTSEGINSRPAISPDGTRLAFSSRREGSIDIDLFVKDLRLESPATTVFSSGGNEQLTQWHSDSLIVLERSQSGETDLWTVDPSDPSNPTSELYMSTEANEASMVVSPDGTLAAYASNETGRREIYLRSFPEAGQPTLVSQGGGNDPFWAPDGSALYYAWATPGGLAFMSSRIDRSGPLRVSAPDTLFVAPGLLSPFQGSGLHPEGDRFVLRRNVAAESGSGETSAPDQLILVQNFFEELKRLVPN